MSEVSAGIGDIVIGKKNDVLIARGLGSCIALVIYSNIIDYAVMAHIMLPESLKSPEDYLETEKKNIRGFLKSYLKDIENKPNTTEIAVSKCKYAEHAVPIMLYIMEEIALSMNIKKGILKAKMAGGAKMFETVKQNDILLIGERNQIKSKELLKMEKINVTGEDCGGNSGRTVYFNIHEKTMKVMLAKGGSRII